jgi:ABC-type dipeptide/oligopeptide/nickel transport system permease component
MLLTMFLVSVAVFAITEAAPGNVARNVLGIQITADQEASFLAQNGLDKPMVVRYLYWLLGTDWRAASQVGLPVRQITTPDGFKEWWAVAKDGTLVQWKLEGDNLIVRQRQPDGSVVEKTDDGRWQVKNPAAEAARLEQYRADLMNNSELTQADRQAVLQAVDQILEILSGKDQGQAALLAALAKPEGILEAMRDPNAPKEKQALQKAAADISNNDILIQTIAVYQAVSSPSAGKLKPGDLQSMASQLNKAFVKMRDLDPALSGQLQQVYESFKAGDTEVASTTLASLVPTLGQLTGNLGVMTDALENGNYQQAASVLRDLSDPAKTPFDASQLAVLPGTLQAAGKTFNDADPKLGGALLQAVTSLKAGSTQDARKALAQAADVLSGIGQVIARDDAAGQARVGRTFWGIDTQNHAVRWETGSGKEAWVFIQGTGWKAFSGGPMEYIPLQKGLLRGDPGISLRTGRPVADLLFLRLRNSLVLAGTAFVIVMPLALIMGVIAGLNEGKPLDRLLSIGGMMFSVTPEFATGIFLILIFAFWLKLLPGATVFGEKAPWTRPAMLVLPVLTLTLVELGYVLRITRASMVDVMKAPYIRTAFLKGLPYWRIVLKHAVRNALMAPITVIMLHVNWLLGGIVVVEVIFGYPGLGSYLLDSALFKDFNAIEGGAMILVMVAVATQLLADIIYTFLNPRIRYA